MVQRPSGPASASRPVQILKVEVGKSTRVRFLAGYLGGLLHYGGKRYSPCPNPETCPATIHRQPTVWKGWAAAEVLDASAGVWWPTVVEVTEKLDEVLSGRSLRGECWDLVRLASRRKGKPLTGTFVKNYALDRLRPAFDVLPVLQRCYHVLEIALGLPNPMPRQQVFTAAVDDAEAAPPAPAPAAPGGMTSEQREQLRQLAGRSGNIPPVPPQPSTNGKGVPNGR